MTPTKRRKSPTRKKSAPKRAAAKRESPKKREKKREKKKEKKKEWKYLDKAFVTQEVTRATKILTGIEKLALDQPNMRGSDYVEDQAEAVEKGLKVLLEHGRSSEKEVRTIKELINRAEMLSD